MVGTGLTATALVCRKHITAAWLTVIGVCTTSIRHVVHTALSLMPDGERLVAYGPLQSEAVAILILSTTFAVLCTIGILGVVAEMRHRHWQNQMRRDTLTGVLTRAAFFEQAAARLVASVGRTPLRLAAPAAAAEAGESTLVCTVSVAHATWPAGAAAETAIAAALPQSLQRADQALYRAKQLGRNRCEAAPGSAAAAIQPPWPGRELTPSTHVTWPTGRRAGSLYKHGQRSPAGTRGVSPVPGPPWRAD